MNLRSCAARETRSTTCNDVKIIVNLANYSRARAAETDVRVEQSWPSIKRCSAHLLPLLESILYTANEETDPYRADFTMDLYKTKRKMICTRRIHLHADCEFCPIEYRSEQNAHQLTTRTFCIICEFRVTFYDLGFFLRQSPTIFKETGGKNGPEERESRELFLESI